MELKRVITAYFSPTGGTRKVAMALQSGFVDGIEGYQVENLSFNCLNQERRAHFKHQFTPEDLLVFCYPVFYGRMPWVISEWQNFNGNGARAVVVSVYGNRAIEDAERETMDFLTKHGFKVVGAIEAIAEHSNERSLAADRPNDQDKAELKTMAQDILQRFKLCDDYFKAKSAGQTPLNELEIKSHFDEQGDLAALAYNSTTPYKAPGKAPGVPYPLNYDECDMCGRCAKVCPAGIISLETMLVAPKDYDKCMGCRACMTVCRRQERGFSDEVNAMIAQKMSMVKKANLEPKPNKLRLA